MTKKQKLSLEQRLYREGIEYFGEDSDYDKIDEMDAFYFIDFLGDQEIVDFLLYCNGEDTYEAKSINGDILAEDIILEGLNLTKLVELIINIQDKMKDLTKIKKCASISI